MPVLDYTAYPTEDDVRDFVSSALGTDPDAGLDYFIRRGLDSAVKEFETRTRWRPFLASQTPETRLFDSALSGYLDLAGGLVRFDSLTVGGSAYTLNTQFWLRPDNAPSQGLPYTAADFTGLIPGWGYPGDYTAQNVLFFPGSGHRAIAITGLWGYSTTAPEDVWQAILSRASGMVLQAASARTVGALKSFKEADVEETYSDKPFAGMMDLIGGDFEATVGRYRRMVVG